MTLLRRAASPYLGGRSLAIKPKLSRYLSGLLVLFLALPMTKAQFVIDDWIFVAVARLQEADPFASWSAWGASHFYEPLYFRPSGMFVWLQSVAWLGGSFIVHFWFNVFLHLLNVSLFVACLRRLGINRLGLHVAVWLAALGPVTLVAALWPSNRFDLLATFGSLLVVWLSLVAIRTQTRALYAGWVLAAILATLFAVFSKEWAYPLLAAWALILFFLGWFSNLSIDRMKPRVLAICLLTTLVLAFAWRHAMLTHAYAAVPRMDGASLASAFLGWAEGYGRWSQMLGAAPWALFLAALTALMAWLAAVRLDARWAGALGLLLLATILPQLGLARGFAAMLNGEPLGTISYARFFYAPWFVLCAILALGVSALPRLRATLLSLVLILATLGSAWPVREAAQQYASWSSGPIQRMAREAAVLIDRQSQEQPTGACVLVLLDTMQDDRSAWFARFADVAAKAYSQRIEATARCHVMTEMTPYIFLLPAAGLPESPQALRPIINPDGSIKKDEGWARVRYRYRLPPTDLRELQEARFWRWNGQSFLEVSHEVRTATQALSSKSWGF